MTSQHNETSAADIREQRRDEVALATARLIARGGFEAVRVREIAQQLGTCTNIVSHYFDSKKELLLLALRQCAARQLQRLKEAIARGAGIAECLETFLPLDEERAIDARVWMVFWAQSIADEDILAVQRDFGQRWRRLIIGMMRIRGDFAPGTPRSLRNRVAQQLQIAIAGVAIHGTLGVWSEQEQRLGLAKQTGFILAMIRRETSAPEGLAPALNATGSAAGGTEGVAGNEAFGLARENARLRKMLVDAMLQIEALQEPRLDRAS